MVWSERLLVVNCILLIAFQLGVSFFNQVSIDLIEWMQTLVMPQGAYDNRVAWAVAEVLGPDPRFFTMLFILLFSRSGEEASGLILLRFLATYTRWGLGMLLQAPRPSWLTERVEMLHCASSFGLPAGHAVLFASFFTYLCQTRRWYYAPPLLVWFLGMCAGRLFLGTHSLQDLILGTMIGINLTTLVSRKSFVYNVRKFFYDQGFWFVVLLLCFGVSSSFGFAEIMRQAAPSDAVMQAYQDRVAANHCPKIHPYSAVEGSIAFSSLCGLLFSMSLGNFNLEQAWGKRFAAFAVFVVPTLLRALLFFLAAGGEDADVGKQFWARLGLPRRSLAILTCFCNMVAILLLFTSQTAEEEDEVQTRRRLLGKRPFEEQSLYGTLPPRKSSKV